MWPDRVSNSGLLALVSDALPTALRGPAVCVCVCVCVCVVPIQSCLRWEILLLKNHSHFSGAKTTTCTGKSFHTFLVAKQTFIPTYMHQKILACNKTRQHWRKCF